MRRGAFGFEEKKLTDLLSSGWLLNSRKTEPSHLIGCGKRLWRLVFGKWGGSVVGMVGGGGSVFM